MKVGHYANAARLAKAAKAPEPMPGKSAMVWRGLVKVAQRSIYLTNNCNASNLTAVRADQYAFAAALRLRRRRWLKR